MTTLYDVVDRWDDWPLLAVMRCTECGRRIGQVRDTPAGTVVYAGKATRWTTGPGEDEPADPAVLLSDRPWGLVAYTDSPEHLGRLFHGLSPAWCRRCRRACGYRLAAVGSTAAARGSA